jgi:hypothetical protein
MVYSVKDGTRDALLGHMVDTADQAVSGSCNEQSMLFTIELRGALQQRVEMSKTCSEHRSE